MKDQGSKEAFTRTTTYKYHYDDDFRFSEGTTMESFKDDTEFRAISINDDYIGEIMQYEVEEVEYNRNEYILREKTQRMGYVTSNMVYEYTYDHRLNPVKKKRNEGAIDFHGNRTVYNTYENIYDDEGRLIQVVQRYSDGRLIDRTEFIYYDDRLIKKETRYNNGDYETIDYIYNDQGMLHEEIILKNGELSHYYQYSILEDGRIKKILLSPTRGKYHWGLTYSLDDQSCTIDIHDPILTVDMIKEIMDYIIEKYGEINITVMIIFWGLNLIYRYEDPEIYKYYEDKYGIYILENY